MNRRPAVGSDRAESNAGGGECKLEAGSVPQQRGCEAEGAVGRGGDGAWGKVHGGPTLAALAAYQGGKPTRPLAESGLE
ncbi:MAG: hypothetical protein WD229_01260 [Pirellulales bacterium]